MRLLTQDVQNESRGKINTQPFNEFLWGINTERINVSSGERKPIEGNVSNKNRKP